VSKIKTKFKIIFVFVLLLSICLANTVYAEDSAVKETVSEDNFDSIQNLVDGANPGDSIYLQDNEYLGNGLSINIYKNITIYGVPSKTILNADSKSTIFTISSNASVNLVGISFKNGYGNYGGAIDNSGKLTVSDSVFIQNSAYNGGAIYNKNTLDVKNITATSNKASLKGGFIFNIANLFVVGLNSNSNEAVLGGVIHNDGFAQINDSKFNSNKADEAGAIYSTSTLIIDNSQFSHNQVNSQGGALSVSGYGVNINNSLFSFNTGADEGGAIFNYNTNIFINNSKFASNNARSYGAAIDNNGKLTVENSLFDKNYAYGAGAIDNAGLLYIATSNFTNNKATKNGGAIDNNGDMNITGCIFENNNAGVDGGAIILRRTSTISHSIFLNNFDSNGFAIFNNTYDDISLINNWWGLNNPDFTKLLNINISDDFTWIKMSVCNSSSFIQEKTITLAIGFNEIVNRNNNVSKLKNPELLPTFKVGMSNGESLSVKNGSVSKQILIPKTNIFTITADNESFIFNVSIDLDKIKRITNNKNIVEDYKGKTTFKVRVIGDDEKPVGKDVAIVMKIGKNSYTVKTDKNGYATKTVSLLPGKYTVTTTYKGYSAKNTITIKNVLYAKSITKKKAKNIKFSATLKNSNKKPIVGKKITFKINGKTYSAKTNSKGIATTNLKNLKVGKYTIVVKYLNSQVKATVKVKK